MIGFHYQGNSDNWPAAVARLPKGAPVKVIDGVQRCVEAKQANADVYTVVRHHVQEQNPSGDLIQHARDFFASFVDNSFRQIAWAVDAVQEYNEYFANSQTNAERQRWIDWIEACVTVWRDDYRTQEPYAHIDLILAETAVGNDIPLDVARIAHDNLFCVLGYHPYVPVWQGEMRPDHWRWYSGRWAYMDDHYRASGYYVRWFFGEFGAVGHNGPGWPNSLAANDGWKHDNVYNGDLQAYLNMMTEWAWLVNDTHAWKSGRVIGATIFTSGGGSLWKWFEVAQPEMNVIAERSAWIVDNMADPIDPPPPPIDPPTTDNLLVNPSFEDGWIDLAMTAQQPNGWTLERAPNGTDVRGRPVTGQPECVHKHNDQLPPDEQLGGNNALILDPDYVYKIFEVGATWKAKLSQNVGVKAGQNLRFTVPLNIHFDGRPDEYDPLDTLIEFGIEDKSFQFWMNKESDRQWWYPQLDYVVQNDGAVNVWIAISVKWEHPTSVFMDALTLEAIDEPEPPEPDCKGEPREQYKRRVHVLPGGATKEQWLHVAGYAYDNERQTVGGSYDDAGIGALDEKTAILWGLHPDQHETFITWYSEEYPGTIVEFRDFIQAEHAIVDIVDSLPVHETKTYNTRALSSITDLIIHHTVSPDDRTSASIAAFHVNSRDWPGISYHYVIGADGTIEQTNKLETVSYHASAANGYSVGIALKGDFTNAPPPDAQIDAAAWLVNWLRGELKIDIAYGHKEAEGAATQCPGNTWPEWKDRVI